MPKAFQVKCNVTLSHVLVTSGAKEDDYEASEEPSKTRAEEPTPAETSSTKKEEAVEAGGQGARARARAGHIPL